jgi:hypothetical protein
MDTRDIVERLRHYVAWEPEVGVTMEDAANEIERLRSLVRFQDNVIRSGDTATLTDGEREALVWASSSHKDMARLQMALKTLLERFPEHDSR